MIASLTGRLKRKASDYLILDVSGVGYHVLVPLSTYSKLPDDGGEICLHIHTHLREDSLCLYGFFTQEEKDIFHLLISVSGIGPKLALSVLSHVQPPELVSAIKSGDDSKLCAIPGIGKKTAARMLLELKDKVASFIATASSIEEKPRAGIDEDAVSALLNLGYKKQLAEEAVSTVLRRKPELALKDIVKESLAVLTKR